MKQNDNSAKNLLYRAQWIFVVVSVIPLAVLAFVCMKYVFPNLKIQNQTMMMASVYITLGLTVLLSVLGYVLSRRNTDSIIASIEHANKRLAALLGLGNRLGRTTNVEETLEEAARSAMVFLDGDAGFAYMSEKGTMVCHNASGVTVPNLGTLTHGPGEGICGEAAKTRKPVRIVDVSEDDRFVDKLAGAADFNTGPVLCNPMVSKDRVVGAIELRRRAGTAGFTDEDEHLLEILGQQTTATVLNSTYRETQKNYFAHMIELLRLALEENIVWESHLQNVARYANLVSRKLNIEEESRREIHFAAMLHDIGFLRLRDVLGRAEAEGFHDKIKQHPVIGAKMIAPIRVWKNAAPLILNHHEYCDGSGYPEGLREEQIPLGARIICVVEAFDTMVNPKSYAALRTRDEAMEDLEDGAGSKYDSAVVQTFQEVLREER